MFSKFPHLPVPPGTSDEEQVQLRRVDWHALLARLQAERDLRYSLDDGGAQAGLAMLMAEGSFDPRAAEMIFALAAGASVAGDLPGRRFTPEDISQLSQETGRAARLRNAKPSDCNNPSETTEPDVQPSAGFTPTSAAESSGAGNGSRT